MQCNTVTSMQQESCPLCVWIDNTTLQLYSYQRVYTPCSHQGDKFNLNRGENLLFRSSLINFACIGFATRQLVTQQAKGSKTFSCLSLELSFQKFMNRYFFQKASEENLCKYSMLTLVSKEVKIIFQ